MNCAAYAVPVAVNLKNHTLTLSAVGKTPYKVSHVSGKKTIVEISQCIRMIGFHARSERDTKEAVIHSHSRHIHWVQHFESVVLCIQSIG
jgi:hypothetical protein